MKKSPCIINMTSVAMRHGAPTATVYGAAKAAIDSFTQHTVPQGEVRQGEIFIS